MPAPYRPDLVVFDLETTATDPAEARIVEIGIVARIGGRITERGWLVNPGVPIPPDASAVHGIDDARVEGAPPLAEVLPEVLELLGGHAPIAGYNAAAYDGPVLNAEVARLGELPFAVGGILDPVVAIRWHYRAERFRKLGDVCDLLGVPLDAAHSAVADARATLGVIDELFDREAFPADIDEALRVQAGWARRQAEEFDRWGYWIYTDRATGALRMGAGKHCGALLERVPRSYLRWCSENIPDLPPATREAFR